MNIPTDNSNLFIILSGILFLLAGYGVFRLLLNTLPNKLSTENQSQANEIISKANRQREKILLEARRREDQKRAIQLEEVETQVEDLKLDLNSNQDELNILSETVEQVEVRLTKQITDNEARKSKLVALEQKLDATKLSSVQITKDYRTQLEKMNPEIDVTLETQKISESKINKRQLTSQKSLKDLTDELAAHSPRLASRMLSRVSSRYAPNFAWPKANNVVEIVDQNVVELLTSGKFSLLEDLIELTEGVNISITTDKEDYPLGVKLVGGYGIYKESARLTLESILNRGPSEWSRAKSIYLSNKLQIENKSLSLGRLAVKELQINPLHNEIMMMIGALNWRTSYRQNQYLHSIEVARLAGILAFELGVNPEMAKRCGLLHDIGKGIDYRIEGSHAVISGDYADRFGESRLICDTVMSHHNDLVLETPLSYILKTADTLSGARPGARVNIEEGYQIRLSAIDSVVKSFKGIGKVSIMSGGREVHIEVVNNRVKEHELEKLTSDIARKIEEEVAFPGQIKVMVTRRFESSSVA